jgi:hypothetical protein
MEKVVKDETEDFIFKRFLEVISFFFFFFSNGSTAHVGPRFLSVSGLFIPSRQDSLNESSAHRKVPTHCFGREMADKFCSEAPLGLEVL